MRSLLLVPVVATFLAPLTSRSVAPTSAHVGREGATTVLAGRVVWDAATTWQLQGEVVVGAGAELVIEPGTRVEALAGASLTITRDGRLSAIGTVLQPIVLTCKSQPAFEGCWEGVTILGHARVNFGAVTSPPARGTGASGCRQSGVGSLQYGGCDDADSSGVLRYVRIEHANTGLQLRAVGSATAVEFVQVNRARNDGLTVVGGTVGVRHVLLTGNRGYGMSWLGGWRGRGQFIAVQQDARWQRGGLRGSNASADDAAAFFGSPRSAPTLHNVTVVAPSVTANPFHAQHPAGVVLAGGTGGVVRNVLVYAAPIGFGVEDQATCTAFLGEVPAFSHVLVAGSTDAGDPDGDPSCLTYSTPDVELQWLSDGANASRVLGDPMTVAQLLMYPDSMITPDVRPRFGSDAATLPVASPPADPFFVAASYIGAIPPATAMRSNVPWYAGWSSPAPAPPLTATVTGIVASTQRGPMGNAVVRTSYGATTLSNAAGQFSIVLPLGQHVLSATELPHGCGAAGTPVTVGGASVSVNIDVTCTVATSIASGGAHVCLASQAARSQCWGTNAYGELGAGFADTLPVSTPINVPTLYTINSVVAGYSHSCGLAQGVALCWGANVFGVLGVGSIGGVALQPTPVQTGGVAFAQLVSGGYHTCGLTAAGEAWCWGWNAEGQTGIGSVGSPVILPQRVQDGGLRFASLAAGESHTCGLTAAGVAYCWGGNARGELGSDPGVVGAQRPTPTMVPGVPALSLIDGGTLHSCALATTGEAWCWGDRTSGQTGDGVVDGAITSPHLVSGTMTWAHLATAGSTTCAVEAGTLDAWCWGRGDQGSLGNGAFPAHSALPVRAGPLLLPGPVLTTPRVDVGPATGAQGSLVCATTTLGTVLCWGPGGRGQLGDGMITPGRAVAAPVLVRPPTG